MSLFEAIWMQKFMTIKQAAQELGVNESTVLKWELKGNHPNPDMLARVHAFLAAQFC